MASETHQQVDELLGELTAVFEAETADTLDPDELDELADQADELVSTADLPALAAAVGLGAEDDPPSSVPEAVATGEQQDVAALRSLLTLSKLSTAEGGQADDLVSELESLVETAAWEPAAEAEPAGDDGEATERSEPDAEESTSQFKQLLQSQLEETQDVFDQVPDLEGLTDQFGGDDTDTETADESEESQSDTADGETQDEQSTRSSDGTRWRPGGKQRTTHSTVPTTGRRDIGRRAGRFSTARGSTVSNR